MRRSPFRWQPSWATLAAGVACACSGRGPSDPGFSPGSGELTAKPGGGYFLADSHHGGKGTRVRLLEVGWGRMVDVHDVDEQGRVSPIPVLRDVVIGEGVQSDGTGLVLETNPITHDVRLIVLRPRAAPDLGAGTFASVLARATGSLGGILDKPDDGSGLPPFSFVARNAVLVLRFDDLLEDGPEAREILFEAVRLTVGYPPVTPQPARIVFDPSHGGIADGAFHSTRVLVDFTVSEREVLDLPGNVPINAAGVPPSSRSSQQPNGSLHLPTLLDAATGRFVRLTNLAGRGLELGGPVDAATHDLVRAFRSGNSDDAHSGYLFDLTPPSVVGTWPVAIDAPRDDPGGPPGHGFEVDLVFRTSCRSAPRRGDTLELAGELYEVREPGAAPDVAGRVRDLRLLRLEPEPLSMAGALAGAGDYLTAYRLDGTLQDTCWVSFAPLPLRPPGEQLASEARIRLRFSEPMDPETFRAFDSFRVLRGRADVGPVRAQDLVIGAVLVEPSLQVFSFVPRLPFDNQAGLEYRFELVDGPFGVRDLTGTVLADSFGQALFHLAEDQPRHTNQGFALRFSERDELEPPGNDVRGQISYDFQSGVLRPRPPLFATHSADRGNPIPSLMLAWPLGVQTPLSAMGSKLQAIWRHCDLGFRVRDENFHNLDVIGLSWSPLAGRVSADFFPLFELRVAHSRFVPDETFVSFGPKYPLSGLLGDPFLFTDNLLVDPRAEQVIVHPRGLGYVLLPSDLTLNGRGTPLMPFPWNRVGVPATTFTWRDTAVLAKGGANSPGVPLDIEVGAPILFDQGPVGAVGALGEVPSIGLPLLWEVRCFPTTQGLGLNSFDILLPIPGWPVPNFRAFSTGGVGASGQTILVDPDLELRPSGGFNPNSRPPGLPTPLTADNSFYIGAIDSVVRVSRAISAWIDSGDFAPRYVEPVVEPRNQIGATSIVLEYRGAHAFSEDAGDAPFNADRLDPYGNAAVGTTTFLGDGTWSDDIHTADGARFLQVRFTFVNDVDNGLAPELDSFGLAFEVP